MRSTATIVAALVLASLIGAGATAQELARTLAKPAASIRVAVFNVALARNAEGALIDAFRADEPRTRAQVAALAEIIQRVRPDILLIQELDYDPAGEALSLFEAALAQPRGGAEPIAFADRFQAPVNAGLRTGFDLDGDGATSGPADAQGWGVFAGQFGMAILSRFPIDRDQARTFRTLLWSAVPGAEPPRTPEGAPYYPPEIWRTLRLSSKSHWDAPIRLPDGRRLHILASHPTPPVFDGPEDRNGLRNAAEITFWTDYVSGADWPRDDRGRAGGLAADASFVLLGDLNADPEDGDGRRETIRTLLDHPRITATAPESAGGAEAAAQGGVNARHRGSPARDTADWKDEGGGAPGNLRVDYVLPSSDLIVLGSGVFWPAEADPLRRLVGEGFPVVSSDHRLVWVDIAAEE